MDKSQLVKVPLKYGIAGGVFAIILFLVLYHNGEYPLDMTSYLVSGGIVLIMLIFSVKELRDYKYGGHLEYWQGMTTGFVCVFIVALISGCFIFMYASQIDQNILLEHQRHVLASLSENPEEWIERHGNEVYEEMLQQSQQLISPLTLAFDDFLKKMLIGLLLTTVIALFYKRS